MYWISRLNEDQCEYHSTMEDKLAALQVEAWFDRGLYVWHLLSGICGTNNVKTMVAISSLFRDIVCGVYNIELPEPYRIHINGVKWPMGYFLGGWYLSTVDDICESHPPPTYSGIGNVLNTARGKMEGN